MFNATGQSGVLFGNPQNQNFFGQTQNQSSGFFGSSNSNLINGTTIKYVPLNGTDTIQKNNSTVNVATKLNCISAMKEYEAKSLEELRFEDYTANRINPPKSNTTTMFGGNQTTPTLFNNQNSLFQNSSPFGLPQQNVLGTTTQTPLFGSTNPTNAFGSKALFGNTPTSTNSAFGTFNNQSKTGPLFGTSTQNKQLFGSPQPTQSTSLFGASQQTSSPSIFGNQQQQQTPQTGFFGGLQSQQQASQSTGLFNANTSTSSFGFQSQSSTGLFGGNTAAKPFGAANTNFQFANAQTSPSLFGGNTQSGGLFTQNTTNQGFGSTAKPSLFSNTNTFTTPASSQSQSMFPQSNTGFGGQTNNMFGGQPKTNQSPFGTTSVFNNTQKPNLFGPSNTTGFGIQNTSLFGSFPANNQSFGSTITTSTIASGNTSSQIGITTPAEAALQHQVAQQKILSLVSNRPYGINKLFMGQNMTNANDGKQLATLDNNTTSTANNANIISIAIKRSEVENLGVPQRRRILNRKTKINPNQMSNAFSGFDEDEDYSVKSNKFDNFMVKREDWKSLPPNAFEKSRKCLVSNNSPGKHGFSSPIDSDSRFVRETSKNLCSTPLSNDSFGRVDTLYRSSDYNGRASPIYSNNKRDSSIDEKVGLMKSKELKEESLTVLNESGKISNDSYNQNKSNNQLNRKENSGDIVDDDDDDDESINGEIFTSCQITLTKEGYYTAPTIDTLNRLVNNNNQCLVENFIIGRKGYGSIRFPGYTNVFGLNMDEIVNIYRKEVVVYPNEELKPEEGEGLNKPAQIVLYEIFPVDKSSGNIIKETGRLKTMKFEERLQKMSEKIGAKFISYTPEKGIWIFEVDHFSRYGYFESDDEEVVAADNHNEKEVDSTKISLKKETIMKTVEKENISSATRVVSAEADSLSNIEDNQGLFKQKSAYDKLLVNNNSRNLYKLKQSLYNYDSDEEVGSSGFFTNEITKHNNMLINKFEHAEIEKYQPIPKKFETCEMGERIFNSHMEYSNSNLNFENQFIDINEENDRRTIKPLMAEYLAPTVILESCSKSLQRIYIPNHLRDLKNLRMPYLFDKFMRYVENVTVDVYKNYSNSASLIQGNRFRVGLNVSCDENSRGIKFIKINNVSQENDSASSFRNLHKRNTPNALMVLRCNYELSNYQEKLIDSAYLVSECLFEVDSRCPLWSPVEGLDVLKSYLNTQNEFKNILSDEKLIFGRIIELCNALWNNVGNEKDCLPRAVEEVCRKQLLSKWIRMECREKLMKEAEAVLNSSIINIDKCNTLILNALCSGEINLACQLALSTKQHRLSLLIAQSASNSQSREMLKEQINQWFQSKTDLHIPPNLLCIYVILSGQTSFVLSDGSNLAPLKHMNWVQAFGSHLWHTQSYLGSIKSAIELYDEVFKTELDIPSPFPVGEEQGSSIENDKYYDCCYHLIKLYCDRLYDLDVLLNPPTISRDFSHKLSWDWSASWHLANILTSLGFSKHIPSKISTEYAAQLERSGLWQMAAFVILHVPELSIRSHLMKSLIYRHVKNSKNLTDKEQFLVDKLNVPIEWIHEGKAIYCKSTDNIELEAYHWLNSGQFERSYQLYINHVIPNLLINDKFEKIKEILGQFVNNKTDRVLVNWPINGEIYLKYIYIETTLRTLRLTNKLSNHSYLIGVEGGNEFDEDLVFDENEELNIEIEKLKIEMKKLIKATEGFKVNNEAQRICKQQFLSVSNRFLQMCSSDKLKLL